MLSKITSSTPPFSPLITNKHILTDSNNNVLPPSVQPPDLYNKENKLKSVTLNQSFTDYPHCSTRSNIIDNYGFDNGVKCHQFASCISLNKNENQGICFCNSGYEGDGYTSCT